MKSEYTRFILDCSISFHVDSLCIINFAEKGRPTTHCPNCRDLRKINKTLHTKCICADTIGSLQLPLSTSTLPSLTTSINPLLPARKKSLKKTSPDAPHSLEHGPCHPRQEACGPYLCASGRPRGGSGCSQSQLERIERRSELSTCDPGRSTPYDKSQVGLSFLPTSESFETPDWLNSLPEVDLTNYELTPGVVSDSSVDVGNYRNSFISDAEAVAYYQTWSSIGSNHVQPETDWDSDDSTRGDAIYRWRSDLPLESPSSDYGPTTTPHPSPVEHYELPPFEMPLIDFSALDFSLSLSNSSSGSRAPTSSVSASTSVFDLSSTSAETLDFSSSYWLHLPISEASTNFGEVLAPTSLELSSSCGTGDEYSFYALPPHQQILDHEQVKTFEFGSEETHSQESGWNVNLQIEDYRSEG